MKKENFGRNAASEFLGLPRDACLGETILTFIGRNSVRIENYRSILIFSDTVIKIQARPYRLCLTGKRLKICCYDRDEMEIVGQIESINFE